MVSPKRGLYKTIRAFEDHTPPWILWGRGNLSHDASCQQANRSVLWLIKLKTYMVYIKIIQETLMLMVDWKSTISILVSVAKSLLWTRLTEAFCEIPLKCFMPSSLRSSYSPLQVISLPPFMTIVLVSESLAWLARKHWLTYDASIHIPRHTDGELTLGIFAIYLSRKATCHRLRSMLNQLRCLELSNTRYYFGTCIFQNMYTNLAN
jgi:hypothetical protein